MEENGNDGFTKAASSGQQFTPKKIKGKGCLTALGIFIALLIIIAVIGSVSSDDKKDKTRKTAKTESSEIVKESKTEEPKDTPKPKVTKKPKITKKPKSTKKPKPTKKPKKYKAMYLKKLLYGKEDLEGQLIKIDCYVEDYEYMNVYDSSAHDFAKKHSISPNYIVCGVKDKKTKTYGGNFSIFFPSKGKPKESDVKIADHVTIYGKVIDFGRDYWNGKNVVNIKAKKIVRKK